MSYASQLIASVKPDVYLRFGESVGLTAADASGNGHTGTYAASGITYGVAGGIYGDPDTAIELTAASKVDVSSYTISSNTMSYGGRAWRTNHAAQDALFGSTSGFHSVFLYANTGTQDMIFCVSGVTSATWTGAWPGDARWVTWGMRFDLNANTAELFINGVSMGVKEVTENYESPGALVVGATVTGANSWLGKMDEFWAKAGTVAPSTFQELHELAETGHVDVKSTISFVPAKGEAMTLGPLANGEGVFLPREGVDGFFPVPQFDEEYAESPDVEGARRVRSRAQNPVGSGSVIVSGSNEENFRKYYRQWEQLVEDMRRWGGTMTYSPSGTTEVITYVIESMRITGAQYNGTQMRTYVQPYAFEYTCLPFGLLPEVTATLRDRDSFSWDSITNQDWLYDAGSGTSKAEGGLLVPTSTAEKRMYRQGVRVADSTVTMKVTTGASVASGVMRTTLKRLDASNALYGQLTFAGASSGISISKLSAGVQSEIASSGTFTTTAAKSYWLATTIAANVATVRVYTEDPIANPLATPLQELSTTLAGENATKYGKEVWGNPGLTATPVGTDYRYDDWTCSATVVRASKPIAAFEVPGVEGNETALGDLKLTDLAAETRRHAEVGVEGARYEPSANPPTLIDSDLLVISGYAGTQTTRTGAYDPAASGNSVITARMLETPQAVCATPTLEHVGRYRFRIRASASKLYAVGTATSGFFRVAYRIGDGQWRHGDWVSASTVEQWLDIDLGVIEVPPNPDGPQRWEAKIEVYAPIFESGTEPFCWIDYVLLVGAEPWSRSGGSIDAASVTTVQVDDGFMQEADATFTGVLAPPLGKAWTVLPESDASDFGVNGSATFPQLERKVKEDTAGAAGTVFAGTGAGRAIGIDSNLSDCVTEMKYFLGAASESHQTGMMVRLTDNKNLLVVKVWETHPEWYLTVSHVKAEVWSAGSAVYTRTWEQPGGTTGLFGLGPYFSGWGTLRVTVVGSSFIVELGGAGESTRVVGTGSSSSIPPNGDSYLYHRNGTASEIASEWGGFTAYGIDAAGPVIAASRWARFRAYDSIRQTADGTTAVGPLPRFEGGRLRIPCAGGSNRTSRIAFKARRLDPVDGLPDEPVNDEVQAELKLTPRVVLL